MPTIVVKGTEGLGNRLLSLEFALRFAHKRQFAIEVDWSDSMYRVDDECFEKHIEIIGLNLTKVDRKNLGKCYPPEFALQIDEDINSWSYRAPLLRHLPSSIAFWRKKRTWAESRIINDQFHRRFLSGEHLDTLNKKYDTYLFTCDLPYREPEHFRHLRIHSQPILDLLAEFEIEHDVDIAVHVRSTDKTGQEIDSLLDQLDAKSQEFRHKPVLHLATDNQGVFDSIHKRLDGKYFIQSIPIKRSYDPIHLRKLSKQKKQRDFHEALADIFVLSRARQLYFQENSSFSRVAIALSLPHTVVTNWFRLEIDE